MKLPYTYAALFLLLVVPAVMGMREQERNENKKFLRGASIQAELHPASNQCNHGKRVKVFYSRDFVLCVCETGWTGKWCNQPIPPHNSNKVIQIGRAHV